MITESEYILVRDLDKIENAERSLRLITPEISDIIDNNEFKVILKKLSNWRRKYYKSLDAKVEVEDNGNG